MVRPRLEKGRHCTKNSRPKPGESGGIVCARDVLVQSGPANELYRATPQVKILGQYGLYVLGLSALIHCFAELNDAAKLVAAAILRVGQDKLRVVLSSHGFRLRSASLINCELLLSFHNDFQIGPLSY